MEEQVDVTTTGFKKIRIREDSSWETMKWAFKKMFTGQGDYDRVGEVTVRDDSGFVRDTIILVKDKSTNEVYGWSETGNISLYTDNNGNIIILSKDGLTTIDKYGHQKDYKKKVQKQNMNGTTKLTKWNQLIIVYIQMVRKTQKVTILKLG